MRDSTQMRRRGGRSAFGVGALGGVAAAVVIAVSGGSSGASLARTADDWTPLECGTYSGKGCSPSAARVDLTKPAFTHPTTFTNSLYPIDSLKSIVMLGWEEGHRFRSESVLLPRTQVVEWDGKRIETLVVQYAAFRDGRIEEVAIDRYAQADDGSVWYLGEDVVDYVAGQALLTAGTWLAGLDGPPAMIMPADPKLGNVYRSENLVGIVFEEMRVDAVGKTVQSVGGPVAGAIATDELSLSEEHATKLLAPGYGEFSTSSGADREDLALAVPIDALQSPEPAQLQLLRADASGLLRALQSDDWEAADAIVRRLRAAFTALPRAGQPPAIVAELGRAAAAATRDVATRNAPGASQAALDATRSVLDLQLRYRPPAVIDRGRFELWCDQLLLDAATDNASGASGDLATLEWIRDRLVASLSSIETSEVDARLHALRIAVDAEELAAAGDQAARLGQRMRSLGYTAGPAATGVSIGGVL
jgi:hypothetical protein